MMRKNVLIVALVLLVALVSCADHEHAWSEWKVVEESTCTKAGSRTRSCIGCNEVETEKLPLKEHSYEWKFVVEPNCVDAGKSEQVCSACGAKGETRDDEALGHEYGEDGKCIRCKNEKTKVEAAEARIGLVYYAEFEEAVLSAVKSNDDSQKTVEVLKEKIELGQQFPINGSVTINANNADFENVELSVYHYGDAKFPVNYTLGSGYRLTNEDVSPKEGDIKIVVNNAKNVHLWGTTDNQRPEGTTISVIMKDCHSEGDSRVDATGKGMLIYLTGNKGITNVLLEGCSSTKSSSPVYTNASGEIVIKDCTFTECAVPINMNYKAAEGTRRVTIDGCTFTACGCTAEENEGLSAYAAPIRVLHTVEGSDDCVTIRNTSITGTVGTNGDVLLLAKHENDSKIKAEKAIFENNKTDIKVVYGKDEAHVKVVEAGASETIEVVLPSERT